MAGGREVSRMTMPVMTITVADAGWCFTLA